jgi:protein SCO1/2
MRKPAVIAAVVAWLVLGGVVVWALTADRGGSGPAGFSVDLDEPLAPMFDVPPIELTDANGSPFNTADLQGRPWVAMFFLTRCPTGACPMMVDRMQELLEAVEGTDVRVVSITADPAKDDPAQLALYAQTIDADPARWHFLTGSEAAVDEAGRALKMVVRPQHDERFLLIDAAGTARGIYSRSDDHDMADLAAAAKLLAEQASEQAAR